MINTFPFKLKQIFSNVCTPPLMGIFRMDRVHHPRQSLPMGEQRPFEGESRARKLGAGDAAASREAILPTGDHLLLPASALESSRGTKTSTYQGSHLCSRSGGKSLLKCNSGTFCVWSLFTMVVDWEVLVVFALSLWRLRPFK